MEREAVLQWLEGVCKEAAGNVVLANKLERQSPSLSHYFINVYKLHSIPAQAWPHYYPALYEEAAGVYADYLLEQDQKAAVVRVDGLESKFERIESMLKALIEAQTPKQQKQIAEALAAAEPPDEPAEDEAETPAEPVEPAAEAEAEPEPEPEKD